MCGGSNKGQTTSTTTQTPAAMGEYQAWMQRLNQVGSQPYVPYGGKLVADWTPFQEKGAADLAAAYGAANPYIDEAAQYERLGASPIQASAIENYQNPYQNMVTQATMGELENVQQANNAAMMGGTLGGGGLFNDRAGVAQGQLANQEAIANAQTLGQLNTSNYNQALAQARADKAAEAQAAYTFGNLGQEKLNTLMQGAQGEMAAGSAQQQQQQAILNSLYGQWQQQQAFPYQQLSWMLGLGTGLGSQMGGTSYGTQTPAQPNPWNQWGGLGLAALGMFAKDGGRVDGYADGGAPEEEGPGPGISAPFGSSVPFSGQGGRPASSPFSSASGYVPAGISMPTSPWGIKIGGQGQGQGQQREKSPQDWAKTFEQAGKGMNKLFHAGEPKGGWGTQTGDGSGVPDYASEYGAGNVTNSGGDAPGGGTGLDAGTTIGGNTVADLGSIDDLGELTAFAQRGGRIHGFDGGGPILLRGYADGGTPDDDDATFEDRFGAASPQLRRMPTFAERFRRAEGLPAATPAERRTLGDVGDFGFDPVRGDRASFADRFDPAVGSLAQMPSFADRFGFPATPGPRRGDFGNIIRPDIAARGDVAGLREVPGAVGYRTTPPPDGWSMPPDRGVTEEWPDARAEAHPDEVPPEPEVPPERKHDLSHIERLMADAHGGESPEKSHALRNALLTAGLGLMASRSPWFGSALGEAGLQGLSAYAGTQASEKGEKLTAQKMAEAKAKLLDVQEMAERKQKEIERHNLATERKPSAAANHFGWETYVDPADGRTKIRPVTGGPYDPEHAKAIEQAKAAGKGDATPASEAATEIGARQIIEGDLTPFRGARTTAQLAPLRAKVADILENEYGMTRQQAAEYLAKKQIEYKAAGIGAGAAARTAGVREENLNLVLRVTDAAVPQALEQSEKVWRTGIPSLNKIIQAGQVKLSGDTQLALFQMANLQLAEGWAKAMNPTGVMRESDRDLALNLLSTSQSKETYAALVKQLQKQITLERDSIRGGGTAPSALGAANAAAAAMKAATGGGGGAGTAPPPAAPARTFNAYEQKAIDWSRKNPDNPDAIAILKRLGVQ